MKSKIKSFLSSYKPSTKFKDDFFSLRVCKLALEAVENGNFGIGSILVNPAGEIVAEGFNQVFNPYFRSDLHGEMVVMNLFEKRNKNFNSLEGFTLYSSLESCPMCMTRLINSGCSRILHVADDETGGMIHQREKLPPVWLELSENQFFGKADCSSDLQKIAFEILMLNASELNSKLKFRSLPGVNNYG